DAYLLMPLGIPGLVGHEGRAAAVLDGELVIFDGTFDEAGQAVRKSIYGEGYTLSWRDGHAIVTRIDDRSWCFTPVNFGRQWRLTKVELAGRPGHYVEVQWRDGRI